MKSSQYRKLCRRIHREFGKKLHMAFADCCECADLVLFGDLTKDQVLENLRASVREECG